MSAKHSTTIMAHDTVEAARASGDKYDRQACEKSLKKHERRALHLRAWSCRHRGRRREHNNCGHHLKKVAFFRNVRSGWKQIHYKWADDKVSASSSLSVLLTTFG